MGRQLLQLQLKVLAGGVLATTRRGQAPRHCAAGPPAPLPQAGWQQGRCSTIGQCTTFAWQVGGVVAKGCA